MSSIDPIKFRSDRYVETQSGWWVRTRELLDIGPFIDRESADTALRNYISRVPKRDSRRNSSVFSYGMEIHEAVNCRIANCAICLEASEAATEAKQAAAN